MVLFKRKTVEFVPPPSLPSDLDLDTQVWFIPETGEWFIDYEAYLDRMNYYNIKKFVCETSGNSNFTYFEALKVERNELQLMETKFPDPVKEPILRYVSFSTVPRIDVMVDDVYTTFKDDFFPGDQVVVKGPHEKFRGVVREKARFNPIQLPDGTVRDGYCSYRVLLETNEEITVNDSLQMSRERNTFTKWFVKSFLKMSLTRLNRTGAPWVIRENIAQKYRIPVEYPPELKQFEDTHGLHDSFEIAESPDEEPSTSLFSIQPANIFDDIKETPPNGNEQEAGRNLQRWKNRWYEVLKQATVFFDPVVDEEVDPELRTKVRDLFDFAGVTILNDFDAERVNFYVSPRTYSSRVHYLPTDFFSSVHSHKIKVWHYEKCLRFFKSINITPRKIEQARKLSQLPGANVDDVKRLIIANRNYPQTAIQQRLPIENQHLLNHQSSPPSISHHGQRASSKPPAPIDDLSLPFTGVPLVKPSWKHLEAAFGDPSDLLEVWIFMNMYNKALLIDNFTFDDFCAALKWNEQEETCQLLLEIFCSLLTAFMNEQGDLEINLPEELIEDEEDEDEPEEPEEPEEEDGEAGEANESDVKSERIQEIKDEEEADDSSNEIKHNAYLALEYRKITWQERLKKRQFRSGGWIIILLGVFSLVEYIPEYSDDINEICTILAPSDYKPTPSTLEENFYNSLSPQLRSKALDILVNLLLNGSVIRNYMDKMAEDSSNLRRERFELIRQLKISLDEAHGVQKLVLDSLRDRDTSAIEKRLKEEAKGKPASKRGRSRGGRPSQNYLPPEPTDLEKAVCLMDPDFMNLIKERTERIRAVDAIKSKRKEMERQLNELSIQRMRYIGRDRLYNRYWWFERNGLPNLGSTVRDDEEEDEEHTGDTEDEGSDVDEGETEAEEEAEEEEDDEEEKADEEEEPDKYVSETYLMGRLWVQGPTDADRKYHLHLEDDEVKVFEDERKKEEDEEELKKENEPDRKEENVGGSSFHRSIPPWLSRASKKVLGIQFDGDTVRDSSGSVIVNQYGSAVERKFSPTERKVLEEAPDVLFGSSDWRYLETAEDFQKLLTRLNPSGIREKALKKEATELQDSIKNSLKSRCAFLGIGSKSEERLRLEKIIEENTVTEEEEIDEAPGETEDNEEDGTEESMEEAEIAELEAEEEEEEKEEKPRTRRAEAAASVRKRKLEELEEKRAQKRAKRVSKPAERIVKRQEARRRKQERAEKLAKVAEAKEKIERLEKNRDRDNALLWVNSMAIDSLGHVHYEGERLELKKKVTKKKKRGRR
ncbi:DEKNAAC103362 [Brettanomyces naardenensis]|uniref:DEKNAAC103362 n=1 Tax=Brettanomyces naardenensis TaxID=13370 RepID=A0A448YNC8_BRENA|nr:DEKNAAC103362 [Brettanomyces naardenensis]